MTVKFEVRHEIDCDIDTFWTYFLNDKFWEDFFVIKMGFDKYDCEKPIIDDKKIARRVNGMPNLAKLAIPAAILKVLSDPAFIEETTFDRVRKLAHTKVTAAGGSLVNEGTIRAEPTPDGKRTIRITTLEITASFWIVGGMVERKAEEEAKKGMDQSAEYINEALRGGGLKIASGF